MQPLWAWDFFQNHKKKKNSYKPLKGIVYLAFVQNGNFVLPDPIYNGRVDIMI